MKSFFTNFIKALKHKTTNVVVILYFFVIAICAIGMFFSVKLAIADKEGFYANLATEFGGILFTVIILDQLNNLRASRSLRESLVRQVESSDNGLALGAIRELEHHGWLRKKNLFYNAWLRKSDLTEAVLFGVDFSGAQLEDVKFTKANLTIARFYRADLRGANFDNAILIGAFMGGVMSKASFIEANLQKADFGESSIDRANFTNAYLQGADLSKVFLPGAIFKDALFDKTTKWPKGFDPILHSAKFTKEKSYPEIDKYL